MTVIVKRFAANRDGRDFVVGDVHGSFTLVERAMETLRFDPVRDRLFCVGDLIDRGPESPRVVEFLGRSYVHAVRGNHEDMLLQEQSTQAAIESPRTWGNGSEWWARATPHTREVVRRAVKQLPIAIEIQTPRGTVGIVHGDVPLGMDWPRFCSELEQGNPDVTDYALWGRDRIKYNDERGVQGIGRLFVGHTPQWAGLIRLGNVYAIDTGAVFSVQGRRLTMINIAMSTRDAVVERDVEDIDARDGPGPEHPFGQYARQA